MATSKIKSRIQSSLYDVWETYIEYVKENEEVIKQLPKLYYLCDGKNGWNETFASLARHRRVPVFHGGRDFYVNIDKLDIFYRDGFEEKNDPIRNKDDIIDFMCHLAGNMSSLVDFQNEYSTYLKESKKENNGSCPRPITKFFIENCVFNLEISFQEFKDHYKGRKEPEYHLSEKQYNDRVVETQVEAAKRMLARSPKEKQFYVGVRFKETIDDVWEEAFE